MAVVKPGGLMDDDPPPGYGTGRSGSAGYGGAEIGSHRFVARRHAALCI